MGFAGSRPKMSLVASTPANAEVLVPVYSPALFQAQTQTICGWTFSGSTPRSLIAWATTSRPMRFVSASA